MSADDRFDELGKALATSTSRRKFLKVAAAAAVAGVLSAVRGPSAAASHKRQCRDADQNCSSDAECCTHFCNNFHCACAVTCVGATGTITTDCCAPGDVCCPGGGTVPKQCVKASATVCGEGKFFSTTTCKCENVTTCGPGTCAGCCQGNLCQPGTTNAACGTGGATCATCTAPNVCCGPPSLGQCKRPSTAVCTGNGQCCSNTCLPPVLGIRRCA